MEVESEEEEREREEEEEEEEDDDMEGIDEDFDDDDDSNMSTFFHSSPSGIMEEKYRNAPDYTIYRPEQPDLSDIPPDAFVTEEDTVGLRKAHRRADRIIEYASDVALIASFHYKKKNFHLVKLLEPIFIIGKRIEEIKGYYFTLLDDKEGDKMAPIIEKLVVEEANRPKPPVPEKPDNWRKRSRRSRRRWTSRQKEKEIKAKKD